MTRLETEDGVGGKVFRSEDGSEGRPREDMVGIVRVLADEGETWDVGEYFEGEVVVESVCRLFVEGGVWGTPQD